MFKWTDSFGVPEPFGLWVQRTIHGPTPLYPPVYPPMCCCPYVDALDETSPMECGKGSSLLL